MTTYETFTVERLTPTVGARITGIDMSIPLSEKAMDELFRAFAEFSLLSFPGQDVSPAQQVEIASLFGELDAPRKFRQYSDRDPLVGLLEQDGSEKVIVGERWHSDNMDYENPYATLVMYQDVSPPDGGDTLFSSMYAAYDALSKPMQEFLGGKVALNDNRRVAVSGQFNPNYTDKGKNVPDPVEHPVIRTHPVTKRKLLYVNPAFTHKIVGLSDGESDVILNYLFNLVASRPDFQCRHRWAPGTLVIWDNRSLQHYAVGDYRGLRRMRRVEVRGDRPYYEA
ncbi:MAG: TauD/TfdA family dioxygenase [Burkholderiaceae bacterium]